ncbi:MAG: hypothetical protein LBT35_02485 [Tannerella sp.]|jgi:hypothetical protein|nr:hypothetical protein [Tannerella sp.]
MNLKSSFKVAAVVAAVTALGLNIRDTSGENGGKTVQSRNEVSANGIGIDGGIDGGFGFDGIGNGNGNGIGFGFGNGIGFGGGIGFGSSSVDEVSGSCCYQAMAEVIINRVLTKDEGVAKLSDSCIIKQFKS